MKALEIFEHVKKHLLTQGVRSVKQSKTCSYKGSEGTQCAIGCLIPDSLYHPFMEGKVIRTLLTEHATLSEYLLPEDMPIETGLSFLSDLQYVHDSDAPINWATGLDRVEKTYFPKEN